MPILNFLINLLQIKIDWNLFNWLMKKVYLMESEAS